MDPRIRATPKWRATARVGWSLFSVLRNFEDPDRTTDRPTDIQVATAARLSARFTYVSPAARSDQPGARFHVVDGGYYDNYGVSTPLAWINQGLQESGLMQHLLLIQVRGAPSTPPAQPNGHHGWFYQAWAPIESVFQVRTTGQRSHNDEELARLTGPPIRRRTGSRWPARRYRRRRPRR